MRGDSCWRDYTCLDYHYETQPMPNPLSWYLHWAPQWTHRFGVGFNHFAELIVPFGYFLPQPISSIAGIITIVFQASIMASGNLSWLNLLTIVLAIPMIDGRSLSLVLPLRTPALHPPALVYRVAIAAVAVLGGCAQRQPHPEHDFAQSGHEHQLQPIASGGNLRRIRRHLAHPL